MSAEEFIRYLSTLAACAGLAVLAIALGQYFGLWAAGLAIFLPAAAIGIPLWDRHFDRVNTERTLAKNAPEQHPAAKGQSDF